MIFSIRSALLPLCRIRQQEYFYSLPYGVHAIFQYLFDKISLCFPRVIYSVGLFRSYLGYFLLKFPETGVVDLRKKDYHICDKQVFRKEILHKRFDKPLCEIYSLFFLRCNGHIHSEKNLLARSNRHQYIFVYIAALLIGSKTLLSSKIWQYLFVSSVAWVYYISFRFFGQENLRRN